jgi:hypothetical protein
MARTDIIYRNYDELGTEGVIALDPENIPLPLRGYQTRLNRAWYEFWAATDALKREDADAKR